ncbi:MAG: THUMP domain-containing protein [Planctomycetota bacterium]
MATFFAACTLGLEQVLARELEALGADGVQPKRGGASFRGDLRAGMRACLWLRSAVRVQQELARGTVRDREDLYGLAASVDWRRLMTRLQTFAVDATVRNSFANDTRFPALVVKDAVADCFRRGGGRPDVDRRKPDVPLKLVLRGTEALLYRDMSGAPLHKRGYREISHRSPLNEATAAGLLMLAEWDGRGALLDPLCGSGTFLIEAAWMARDRAPGLRRSFAFETWKDIDSRQWSPLRLDAERRAAAGAERALELEGNDRHPGATALARIAAREAGVPDIAISTAPLCEFAPRRKPAMVATNPPYGERLDETDPVPTWRDLGSFLRSHCRGASAFVLCGDPELSRHLGLRADRKDPVRNGPIDCRWLRYTIDSRAATEPASGRGL